MSDAAGTAWLDTGARDWSDDLLAATGLSRAQMPRLVEGSAVSGHLLDELAAALGPAEGRRRWPAAAATMPRPAVGLGVVKAGQAFVSLGTSGVLFAANDGYQPDPATAVHTFCHALPGTWHQMGVILAATDALNWFAGITGQKPAELTAGLGALQAPGQDRVPALSGRRADAAERRRRSAARSSASTMRPTAAPRPARCWRA